MEEFFEFVDLNLDSPAFVPVATLSKGGDLYHGHLAGMSRVGFVRRIKKGGKFRIMAMASFIWQVYILASFIWQVAMKIG